jgi:CHAT domain-containing protein
MNENFNPTLPGAETEAKNIAKLFNTNPLTGNQANKSTVLQKISSAKIIHFATHGLLDGKDFGERTPGAIALAPEIPPLSHGSPLNGGNLRTGLAPLVKGGNKKVDVNEGLLKTTEIIDIKLNADLVVLSACDTGRGQITGDGVIGLSRSLITAGASSVIVSLWKIPDESTSNLMTEFIVNGRKQGEHPKCVKILFVIASGTLA